MEMTSIPTLPVPVPTPSAGVTSCPTDTAVPAIVARAGGGRFAWDEFFVGEIRNAHTRKNYRHAVERFLAWCELQGTELAAITPGMVGLYTQISPELRYR